MGAASVIRKPYKALPSPTNPAGSSTTETVFIDASSNVIVLPFPSNSELAGANAMKSRMINVNMCGRVTTAGSYNVTVKMYFGTSGTTSSDTAIASTGAVSVATASANWQIRCALVVDVTSNVLDGWYATSLNGTRVANTIITAAVTTADPDAGSTLGFVGSITFGTGSAANLCYLDDFSLEVL